MLMNPANQRGLRIASTTSPARAVAYKHEAQLLLFDQITETLRGQNGICPGKAAYRHYWFTGSKDDGGRLLRTQRCQKKTLIVIMRQQKSDQTFIIATI